MKIKYLALCAIFVAFGSVASDNHRDDTHLAAANNAFLMHKAKAAAIDWPMKNNIHQAIFCNTAGHVSDDNNEYITYYLEAVMYKVDVQGKGYIESINELHEKACSKKQNITSAAQK